ncbi:Immunoglobulin I-set [Trinorchestia longiramus]|nr:Immunoglobulin I-set [Trinorchestia longiramus]
MVKVENQLLGAPLHTDVAVRCDVEAFPHAIVYWQRDTSEMLLKGKKYNLYEEQHLYNGSLQLVIRDFNWTDAGQYKCVATNSLGKSDTSIRLYVIDVPSPKSTTRESHKLVPALPTNSVGSLDLRRREEFKQSTKGNFELFEGAFDQRQKHLYGNDQDGYHTGRSDGTAGGGRQNGEDNGGHGVRRGSGGSLLSDILGFNHASHPTSVTTAPLLLLHLILISISHSLLGVNFSILETIS